MKIRSEQNVEIRIFFSPFALLRLHQHKSEVMITNTNARIIETNIYYILQSTWQNKKYK